MDMHPTNYVSFSEFLSVWTSRNQVRNIFGRTDGNGTMVPIELTNITGTYLQNLAEDCLLEIFSSNSLTPFDLCSLAETCTRFKQLAQYAFPRDYRIAAREYDLKYEFGSKNEKFQLSTHDVERILKNFGSTLSKLSIGREDADIVSLVTKYCGDYVKFKSTEDATNPDLTCSLLVELEVVRADGCVEILKCTFPNLKRFTWRCSSMHTRGSSNNCDILYKFIRRHRNLITLNVCYESVCINGLLHVIDNSCNELVKLTLGNLKSPRLRFNASTVGSLSKLNIVELVFAHKKRIILSQYNALLLSI